MAALDLETLRSQMDGCGAVRHIGRIGAIGHGTVEIGGGAEGWKLGDRIRLAHAPAITGEIIALQPSGAIALMDGSPDGSALGDTVERLEATGIAPHESWIGRIVDPMGQPLDGRPLIRGAVEESFYNVEWVRRRARTIQNTATKAAILGKMFVNALTFSAMLAVVGVVMLFSHQHGGWLPLTEEMKTLLDRVDPVPAEIWAGVLVFLFVSVASGLAGRRLIGQPDVPPSGIGR